MTVAWTPDDPTAAEILERVISTELLLVALDFDGTLSHLQDRPMEARAIPDAADAVRLLSDVPQTIVGYVSGRSLGDLRIISEHEDESPVLLAGSHGAEFWVPGEGRLDTQDDAEDERLRETLRAEAEDLVGHVEGVWVEPKAFGFGIHTRRAARADAPGVHERIDELVSAHAPQWRRRQGHDLVEYSFRHEGKDSGLAALRERVGATAVLFAGDDVTDEDALRTLGAGDVGVRVGEGETAAALRVRDPEHMAVLLRVLAVERSARQQ